MENLHHKYIIENAQAKKKNGVSREFEFTYHKAGDEGTSSKNKNNFQLCALTIIQEEQHHFFQENVTLEGKLVGFAKTMLTPAQKMNLAHDKMKQDLIKHYFDNGKPEQLFIQKNVNILSAT